MLVNLIRPYRRVELRYLAAQLRITVEEVSRLLVDLIQEGQTQLRIDHVNGILCEVPNEYAHITQTRYNAFNNMLNQLDHLRRGMTDKVQ